MKLLDKTVSNIKHICLFGPPKSGKTRLAGTLAVKKKILLIDMENGFRILTSLPKEWQENIEIVSIPDTRSYPIAIETMLKIMLGKSILVCHEHGKATCQFCTKLGEVGNTRVCLDELTDEWVLVIDSGTQLTASALAYLTKNQPDDYKPTFHDWANQGILLTKILSNIQQAKYNVVFITHESEVEMEDGKKKLVPSIGSSNFSRNSAKFFDDVVYCEIKNRKHVIGNTTTYAGNILTGSRTNINKDGQSDVSLLDFFE